MYSQAGQADFSGIDGTRELFVSTVVQKAFIEVRWPVVRTEYWPVVRIDITGQW